MRAPTPPQSCRLALLACATGLPLSTACPLLGQIKTAVALGDSLTAEYEDFDSVLDIPYPIRDFAEEPTAYAAVTTPGWVSRSWVEVLGGLRWVYFNFGQWKHLSRKPWAPPRLSGFERNWAVPGATAARYEEFFTTSFNSNPLFFGFRVPLDQQLRTNTDRVVIWLGTNDLRAKYGEIFSKPKQADRDAIVNPLKAALIDDLTRIIDRVQKLNPEAEIVVVNLPDLGAAPKIKGEFIDDPDDPNIPNEPDPNDETAPVDRIALKSFVTAATESINAAIVALADAKEIGVADAYSITKSLIAGTDFYYGAIKFTNGADDQNDQHFLFTRDGFHPNTALQVQIARAITRAFNSEYGARIPLVTHFEALKLMKIKVREPFEKWVEHPDNNVPALDRGILKDPDKDGLTNLMEYAFNSPPNSSDAADLPFTVHGPVEGITGNKSVKYVPAPGRPEIDIFVQRKVGKQWLRVPEDHIIKKPDGTTIVVIPSSLNPNPPARIKVNLIPPQGSLNTISTAFNLDDRVPMSSEPADAPAEPEEQPAE